MIRLLGLLSMTINHAALVLAPGWLPGYVFGRFAAPIFFYLLAQGEKRTHNYWRYIIRLAIFGIISQLLLILIDFDYGRGNILLSLAFALLSLRYIQRSFLWIFPFAAGAIILNLDYSAWAIWSVWLFSWFCPRSVAWWGLWILGSVAYTIYSGFVPQLLGVFVPVLIILYQNWDFKMPKMFGYCFYPLHWLALASFAILFP